MLSVITCSIHPPRLAALQTQLSRQLAAIPHEILPITDATGLCEGYNRGLDRSSGEILVFCHDDIHFLAPDFFHRVLRHLETFDVVGVAGTTKLLGPTWGLARPDHLFGQIAHPSIDPAAPAALEVAFYNTPARIIPNVQALDGVFLAFRRPCIEAIRWDAATFPGFHLYDIDTSYRAHLAGYRLAIGCDLPLVHLSRGAFDDRWLAAAKTFSTRHRFRYLPPEPYINTTRVQVPSHEDALEVMTPLHWSPPACPDH
jgi:GT2 family glycosyltransferase